MENNEQKGDTASHEITVGLTEPQGKNNWWPWGKTPEQKVQENYASRFSGKRGFKHFRRVHYPHRQPGLDPEKIHGNQAEAEDWETDKGEVVKIDGKYAYRNEFHQISRKFEDVAVYLSPTNYIPRRLVVQATRHVIKSKLGTGDWIRTSVSGNVPWVLQIAEWALGPFSKPGFLHKLDGSVRMLAVAVPLQVMLAIPGLSTWEDDETADTYTDYPGYYWDWPKYAINYLDMAPDADSSTKQGYALDVRRRSTRPRWLVAKQGNDWVTADGRVEAGLKYVFISYSRDQFEHSGGSDKLRSMAQAVTEMQGCSAYWLDVQLVEKEDGDTKDYDVYTMCDIVRGATAVAVLLGENTLEAKESWGKRMWTLPEGLLAPGDDLLFCYEDSQGTLQTDRIHKVEMTATFWSEQDGRDDHEGGSATRLLAEHFAGLLTLSRLEMLPASITALNAKMRNEFTGSDLAYAVMGLLHYRIERNDSDTLFQNLARLSLGNDSDQLIERMISLLPQPQPIMTQAGIRTTMDRPLFEVLCERDQFETLLYHITPLCDVVGVANEDETVILDNCRAIHIRWKDFPQAIVQRNYGFKKLFAAFFVAAGLTWLIFGVQLAITYIPFWVGFIDQVKTTLIAWLVSGFLFIGLLLSAFAPVSVRRLFGGTVLKSSPSLVGFEGVMRIQELERVIFGNSNGRLTYAPSATPFARYSRHPRERRGTEPEWIDAPDAVAQAQLPLGHQLFTLVDMGELSVAVFSAERPPTVALLTGREGGMLRAVLCSWRFESDCLYRETVVRMPSRVYEAATAKGWLKLSLRTQDQARRLRTQQ